MTSLIIKARIIKLFINKSKIKIKKMDKNKIFKCKMEKINLQLILNLQFQSFILKKSKKIRIKLKYKLNKKLVMKINEKNTINKMTSILKVKMIKIMNK
jgi:hypothetical protein